MIKRSKPKLPKTEECGSKNGFSLLFNIAHARDGSYRVITSSCTHVRLFFESLSTCILFQSVVASILLRASFHFSTLLSNQISHVCGRLFVYSLSPY